jgi:parallel beta-helix repeat protein
VGVGIGAWGTSVFNNTIRNCRVGIAFWGSASNNAFYHNDFLNNSIQVQMQGPDNPVVGSWMMVMFQEVTFGAITTA